jgi:hypothetical protein
MKTEDKTLAQGRFESWKVTEGLNDHVIDE